MDCEWDEKREVSMLLQVIFIKAVKDGTKTETKREESTH